MRFDLRGEITLDEYVWIYDLFGESCTAPSHIREAIENNPKDETLDIYVNSPGGFVTAGQEMYALIREYGRCNVYIESQACSAASFLSMGAAHVEMSPIGMFMVHNVQGGASGDYHVLQKEAQVLKEYDAALAAAYADKSGMSLEDAVKMMDKETWLTANSALELGLIDAIMFGDESNFRAASNGLWLTADKIKKAEDMKEQKRKNKERRESILNGLVKI